MGPPGAELALSQECGERSVRFGMENRKQGDECQIQLPDRIDRSSRRGRGMERRRRANVGHRRDLVSKGRGNVLVGFQLRSPENHWDPFELGKKIRVEESRCRPTMVFVVKPSEGPRGVLAYFSKRWVVVDYAHPVGHVYSFEDRSRLLKKQRPRRGCRTLK